MAASETEFEAVYGAEAARIRAYLAAMVSVAEAENLTQHRQPMARGSPRSM